MIKNIVLENLNQPDILEQEYRKSPQEFEMHLKGAIEKNSDSEILRVWNARLSYRPPDLPKNFSVGFLIALCLIAGIVTKIPSFFSINNGWYNLRFPPLIVIVVLIIYFIKTTSPSSRLQKVIIAGIAAITAYLFILPNSEASASVTMALIHLPLVSLTLLSLSFMSDQWNNFVSRLNFIRYLGEMAIYSTLILLGGMVLTGITFGLFSMTGLSIMDWYLRYIAVLGLVSSPLVATYIFDSVQNRQSKFAPVLSNVFSPLFLITVLVYLVVALYKGNSPYTNREFLINFNGLLIVILALTIFSISGKKKSAGVTASDYINASLVSATLLVDIVALTAILFRWAEHGMSVNRIVVTGANILIFFHLTLILRQYVRHIVHSESIAKLELTVAEYLPVYSLWSLIVSVFLPLAFKFK